MEYGVGFLYLLAYSPSLHTQFTNREYSHKEVHIVIAHHYTQITAPIGIGLHPNNMVSNTPGTT